MLTLKKNKRSVKILYELAAPEVNVTDLIKYALKHQAIFLNIIYNIVNKANREQV